MILTTNVLSIPIHHNAINSDNTPHLLSKPGTPIKDQSSI